MVCKVANFAIDLPDANVAIQVSRHLRLAPGGGPAPGRILRPKKDGSIAHFYTLVTRDTKDQDFATNRQLFLTEQGYSYNIVDAVHDPARPAGRLAQMQAEFEEKKLSATSISRNSAENAAKQQAEEDDNGEPKPSRGVVSARPKPNRTVAKPKQP